MVDTVTSSMPGTAPMRGAAPLSRQKVKRFGQRPLVFQGALLFEFTARDQGVETVRVWETQNGFVVQIDIRADEEGPGCSRVEYCLTPQDVLHHIQGFDPSALLYGSGLSLLETKAGELQAAMTRFQEDYALVAKQHAALAASLAGNGECG